MQAIENMLNLFNHIKCLLICVNIYVFIFIFIYKCVDASMDRRILACNISLVTLAGSV